MAPSRVVVLAGGFGGARMAHGFGQLPEAQLSVVVNVGDDLEIHGLHVSPDLDTVMYTLAGLANEQTGWGVRDETWSAAEMLEQYGRPVWFRLGDRDLATQLVRTEMLRAGKTLTATSAGLAARLGIEAALLPVTDDRVRTQVRTADGWLDFQDYFVRRHHADDVVELRFAGIEAARMTAQVSEAITAADLIVVAPSNPFVSVAPILSIGGMRDALADARAPVIGVSPIVGGQAVRGPAAQMMRAFGAEPSAASVARHYADAWPGLLDVLVIDTQDAADAAQVSPTGIRAHVTGTLIAAEAERRRLAQEILELAGAR
jgi:LPPG:FO 2-phospho-L-lactate transferase